MFTLPRSFQKYTQLTLYINASERNRPKGNIFDAKEYCLIYLL